jgi:hypothetical protein
MNIPAVAGVAFREGVRGMILWGWVGHAALLWTFPFLLGDLPAEVWGRSTLALGYRLTQGFLLLGALLLGARGFQREAGRRLWMMLDSKPMRRWELFLGKWVGYGAVLVLLAFGCFLLGGGLLCAQGERAGAGLDRFWRSWGGALLGGGIDVALVLACSLAFSTFCSWPVAFCVGGTLLVLGNSLDLLRKLPDYLRQEALQEVLNPSLYHAHASHEQEHEEDRVGKAIGRGISLVARTCPDFQRWPIGRNLARGAVALSDGGDPVPWGYVGRIGLYTLGFLAVGSGALSIREFA